MRNNLGDYIRSHRERIKPQDVGLPMDGRRRTPGLRREELAQLCSVSPTWLTWLEQGRPVSASAKMLGKLADVMRLTAAERIYLFRLAEKTDPAAAIGTSINSQSQNVQAIVNAITVPAYILNQRWDVVAWNRAAKGLFTGWLDKRNPHASKSPPNLLEFMFLDPMALALIADWPDRAQRLVAEFRADCGKHADQEPLASLIDKLVRESAEFKQIWDTQHVVGRDGGARRFLHPQKGTLTFEQATLLLSTGHGIKLVMLFSSVRLKIEQIQLTALVYTV